MFFLLLARKVKNKGIVTLSNINSISKLINYEIFELKHVHYEKKHFIRFICTPEVRNLWLHTLAGLYFILFLPKSKISCPLNSLFLYEM